MAPLPRTGGGGKSGKDMAACGNRGELERALKVYGRRHGRRRCYSSSDELLRALRQVFGKEWHMSHDVPTYPNCDRLVA